MNTNILREQLRVHEGMRLKPYTDTVGKLTIGVGRNLSDVGITEEEAFLLLDHDMAVMTAHLFARFPWIMDLDDARQRVLGDMAFNLGVAGLAAFKRMLAAVKSGDYARAADQMLESQWARQVGGRATRLAAMMRDGQDPS